MLYNSYRNRMYELSARIRRILKFSIWIALVLAVIIAALAVFEIYRGTVRAEWDPKSELLYGEKPGKFANALLAKVRVQYKEADTEDSKWVEYDVPPAGEYIIRGMTENIYGTQRYTKEHRLTVNKRNVTVNAPSYTWTYGEKNPYERSDTLISNLLAKGDVIKGLDYEYKIDRPGTHIVKVKSDNLKIVNEKGENVTDCYIITYETGTATVNQRELIYKTGSAEKVYDDTFLVCHEHSLTDGSLAKGDSASVKYLSELRDSGSVNNQISVNITDGSGQSVMQWYSISVHEGTLTVKPRDFEIKTGSAEKIYDAKPLVCEEYEIVKGALEGHSVEVTFQASQSSAGECANAISLKITASDGRIVTDNYSISFKLGVLTVHKRPLSFTTGSDEKVFDGRELKCNQWELVEGTVVAEQKLAVTVTGSQLNAGQSGNTLDVLITDFKGIETTHNYEITVDEGMLLVTPRPISIETGSAEKDYDGLVLTCEEYEIVKGSIVDGHEMSATFTGQQVYPGSSPNTASFYVIEQAGNYDITVIEGTLTVNESDYKPENNKTEISKNPEKFDGTPIFKIYSDKTQTEYLRDMAYGNYNKDGFDAAVVYPNSLLENTAALSGAQVILQTEKQYQLKIEMYGGKYIVMTPYYYIGSDYKITDVCSLDSAKKYTLVYTGGDLFLSDYLPSNYLLNKYRTFVYSNYLALPEDTKAAILKIAADNGIDENSTVEEIAEFIQNSAKYNLNFKPYPDGVDMALYFLTDAKEGICQHYATAATVLYRALGIPARYVTGFKADTAAGQWSDVTDERAHAWVEIYVDNLGWMPVEVTGFGEGSGEGSGGGSFGGNGSYGEGSEGEIPPVPPMSNVITISTHDAVKIYDGKVLTMPYYYISSGKLLEGHYAEVMISGRLSAVGSTANTVESVRILDGTGRDVTLLYSVEVKPGTLTVLQRPITVSTASAYKPYDGKELSCNEYTVSAGMLAKGDTMYVEFKNSLTQKGEVKNEIKSIKIMRKTEDGELVDVTECYSITMGSIGTLTVY